MVSFLFDYHYRTITAGRKGRRNASRHSFAVAKQLPMQEYRLDLTQIEELQAISDRQLLESLFERAKRTIVNGESVVLVRSGRSGGEEAFDTITTLEDLRLFQDRVFRYL
jgi:hypothetical protein